MRPISSGRYPAKRRGPCPRYFASPVGPLVTPSPCSSRPEQRGARRTQALAGRTQAYRNGARHLKKSRDYLLPTASVMSRYAFITACAEAWSVQMMCRLLAVSAAGYHHWRQRPTAALVSWQAAAQAAFTRYARRYGTRLRS